MKLVSKKQIVLKSRDYYNEVYTMLQNNWRGVSDPQLFQKFISIVEELFCDKYKYEYISAIMDFIHNIYEKDCINNTVNNKISIEVEYLDNGNFIINVINNKMYGSYKLLVSKDPYTTTCNKVAIVDHFYIFKSFDKEFIEAFILFTKQVFSDIAVSKYLLNRDFVIMHNLKEGL